MQFFSECNSSASARGYNRGMTPNEKFTSDILVHLHELCLSLAKKAKESTFDIRYLKSILEALEAATQLVSSYSDEPDRF